MAKNRILKDLLDSYTKENMKKAKKDFERIIWNINKELKSETSKMYDSLIDQFYSYHTTSYIRHGQTKPGTENGLSLYRANSITTGGSYKNPTLIIDINSRDMNVDHQYDTDSKVLDYVMYGIRFPYFSPMSWKEGGSYKGKYFNYTGTPLHVFQNFDADFENIVEKIFYPQWKNSGWCD